MSAFVIYVTSFFLSQHWTGPRYLHSSLLLRGGKVVVPAWTGPLSPLCCVCRPQASPSSPLPRQSARGGRPELPFSKKHPDIKNNLHWLQIQPAVPLLSEEEGEGWNNLIKQDSGDKKEDFLWILCVLFSCKYLPNSITKFLSFDKVFTECTTRPCCCKRALEPGDNTKKS